MALVSLPAAIHYPPIIENLSAPSINTILLNGAGNYCALVYRVRKAGNINKVGYFPGSVAGAGAVDVRVETVDGSGNPSGSLWGTNTNASHSPTSSTFAWVTLTASATVAVGDIVALRISYASGTSVRVNNMDTLMSTGLPYRVKHEGSVLKSGASIPVIGCQLDTGEVQFTGAPLINSTTISTDINTGTTPDETGLKITVPFSGRCVGMTVRVVNLSTTYAAKLYDSDGSTVLASQTGQDTDVNASSGAVTFLWSGVELTAGQTYRAVILPETGTSVRMYYGDMDAAGTRASWPAGTNGQWTERTDAGSWTDTNTRMPYITLLFDQLNDGSGGGGGLLVNPGLGGGLL